MIYLLKRENLQLYFENDCMFSDKKPHDFHNCIWWEAQKKSWL